MSKVDDDDVWSKLPHISKKQCIWLALLAWNGAGCGITYTFPVFGQYQPGYECGNFLPENVTDFTNSCPESTSESYICVFNKKEYQPTDDYETIATEFQLVCDRAWINPLITSLTFVAQAIAAGSAGWLSRRLTLRKWIVIFRVVCGASYLLMGFSHSLTCIFILRMVIMASETVGYCIFAFIFAVEIVGPKYTKMASMITYVSCVASTAGYAAVAFYFPDWRHQCFLTAGFMLPFAVAYFLLPDSFQSSFSRGDITAGEASLETFSKLVGSPLDEKYIQAYSRKFNDTMENTTVERDSIFNGRNMVFLLVLVTSLETLSTLCWFGYLLMPDGRHFSFYVDVVLNAISDTLFCIASSFLGAQIGRRGIMLSTSSVGGLLVISAITLQSLEQFGAARWLNFVTKGIITVMNLTAMAYKTEVLPTTVRTEGTSFAQIISKLTSALVPFILFGAKTYWYLNYLIIGSCLVVIFLWSLLMTETQGYSLFAQIRDYENAAFDERRNIKALLSAKSFVKSKDEKALLE